MQDEELYVGGYIIRRVDENNFTIESTLSGKLLRVTEKNLTCKIGQLWKEKGE